MDGEDSASSSTCVLGRGESGGSRALARGKAAPARSPVLVPVQVPTQMQGKGLYIGFAMPGQRLVQAVTPSSHVFELRLPSCFSRELGAGLQWGDVTEG